MKTALEVVDQTQHDVCKAKALLVKAQGMRNRVMVAHLKRMALDELGLAARDILAAQQTLEQELYRRAA